MSEEQNIPQIGWLRSEMSLFHLSLDQDHIFAEIYENSGVFDKKPIKNPILKRVVKKSVKNTEDISSLLYSLSSKISIIFFVLIILVFESILLWVNHFSLLLLFIWVIFLIIIIIVKIITNKAITLFATYNQELQYLDAQINQIRGSEVIRNKGVGAKKCLLCNKNISYSHFEQKAQEKGLDLKTITMLWNNESIKGIKIEVVLLCCECHNTYTSFSRLIETSSESCFVCKKIFKCKRKERMIYSQMPLEEEGERVYNSQIRLMNIQMASRQGESIIGSCNNFLSIKNYDFNWRIKRLKKILVLKGVFFSIRELEDFCQLRGIENPF